MILSQPLKWPRFPYMPVVRSLEWSTDVGVINWYACQQIEDGGPIVVMSGNLFDQGKRETIATFDDVEGLYDAGWRID